jgi:hypothetical protein
VNARPRRTFRAITGESARLRSLVVVGSFQKDKVKKMIEEAYGGLPRTAIRIAAA